MRPPRNPREGQDDFGSILGWCSSTRTARASTLSFKRSRSMVESYAARLPTTKPRTQSRSRLPCIASNPARGGTSLRRKATKTMSRWTTPAALFYVNPSPLCLQSLPILLHCTMTRWATFGLTRCSEPGCSASHSSLTTSAALGFQDAGREFQDEAAERRMNFCVFHHSLAHIQTRAVQQNAVATRFLGAIAAIVFSNEDEDR
jgi:hypothetical protein